MSESRLHALDNLDLEQARRRAKELLAAVRRGDPGAAVRLHHPHVPASLSDAQRALALELGFKSWPRLVRAVERFEAVDLPEVEWSRVREVSVVCFPDDRVALVRRRGEVVLPRGRRNPDEDVWDDTVRRIPMECMGFRHDSTHVFAIDVDRRHVAFWVEGAPDDYRSHAEATATVTLSVEAAVKTLQAQGDVSLARLVSAADEHRRHMTYARHQRDGDRTTTGVYLRASTPQGGSGYSGNDSEWRAARAGLAFALDGLDVDLGRSGQPLSFLDVGCANGHLPASFVTWGAERNLTVDPYGVDLSAALVQRAKELHPQWTDHFWTGDMLTWRHPTGRRFDLVHVLLDVLPTDKYGEAVVNCLELVTTGGGRLLISVYDMRPEMSAEAVALRLGLPIEGRTPPRSRPGGPHGQPSVWITH
jgi:SAM-dependent methyltransferase